MEGEGGVEVGELGGGEEGGRRCHFWKLVDWWGLFVGRVGVREDGELR